VAQHAHARGWAQSRTSNFPVTPELPIDLGPIGADPGAPARTGRYWQRAAVFSIGIHP